MLSYMRKHARSWFIKVLLGTVIIVFIFFYGFSLRERRSAVIAEVDGVKISQKDFQRQLDRILEIQRMTGREITPEQRRALREAALEGLIEQTILLEQAQRWKVTISPQELREQLRSIPSFQENGQFSARLFKQFLRMRGQTEEEFLKDLDREIRVQKVQELIRDSAWVSDEEVEELYRLIREKVSVQYVAFSTDSFVKDVTPTDEEIQDHFRANLSRYRIPEMVRVEFMRFDPTAYLDQVEITEKDFAEQYERTKDRWREEPQVLARQIFVRSLEKEEDKVRLKALEKAEDLLKRLKAGADFEKLAREHSQDPQTSTKGGSWGWKKRHELPEPIARALFDEMKPGELREEPIKTALGFHIVKLEEKKPERIRPLEEVRAELEAQIRQLKARQRAREVAEEAYLEVFQGNPFQEVGKRLKAQIGLTEPFSLQGAVKDLPVGDAFRKAAFLLRDKEDFSEVIEDSNGFFVIQLVERTPSRDPSLDEVREKVELDVKRAKASEVARQRAEAFLEELKGGQGSLSSLAQRKGLEVIQSPPVSRVGGTSGIPQEMVQGAFSLASGQGLIPGVFKQGERYLVGEVKERIPPDPKGLEEEKRFLKGMLLRDKREAVLRDWLGELRSRAQIKTFRALEELL